MIENKKRLVDAARRLLAIGTKEEEVLQSMVDLGISEEEAKSMLVEAKSPKKESIVTKDITESPKEPFSRISSNNFSKITPLLVGDFDKLLDKGGVKKGDIIVLSGPAGTGKTTFCVEFLYKGAKVKEEKGIFFTIDERPNRLKEKFSENFGWDITELESKNLVSIISLDTDLILRAIEAKEESEKGSLLIEKDEISLPFPEKIPFVPNRIVLDNLSALKVLLKQNLQGFNDYIKALFQYLKSTEAVSIIVDEGQSKKDLHLILADGIINLYSVKTNNRRETALEIIKMRSTSHVKKLVPYRITSKGFEVFPYEETYF
ncbi:MAG: ATPase domain-containing protein [Candidatus Diapherotrites archaeon]